MSGKELPARSNESILGPKQPRGAPDFLIAITGASGSVYGVRLLEQLIADAEREIHLVVSRRGAQVIAHELGCRFDPEHPSAAALFGHEPKNVRLFHPDDLTAPCASGLGAPRAMVIIPCSMGTAARIAAGLANDLITRAADVVLKERRTLILVVRETPLSLLHLRHLTTLAEAGAIVLPACPGFYHHPQTIDDLIAFIVERVMEHLERVCSS